MKLKFRENETVKLVFPHVEVSVEEPVYDETKISVILLDASGKRTDSVQEFVRFDEANQYLRSHMNENFDMIVGSGWVRDSDSAHAIDTMDYFFMDIQNLINFDLKGNIGNIGRSAFANCRNLKTVHLSDSTHTIGLTAFGGCTSLEQANIPAVKSWGSNCFSGCFSLTNIDIQEGVPYIPAGAFNGCMALPSIEIPSSVTEIFDTNEDSSRYYAFNGCIALKTIIIHKPKGSITGEPWGCPNPTGDLKIVWTV